MKISEGRGGTSIFTTPHICANIFRAVLSRKWTGEISQKQKPQIYGGLWK